MINIEVLKQTFDCRMIIERDLGRPKYRTHDYSTYRCPFHHEQKGYSLVVYATHWRCYGKCGVGGDVLGWLVRYHQVSFREACERLAGSNLPHSVKKLPSVDYRPSPFSEPPDERWQKVAGRIAERATDYLWNSAGRRALDHLILKRGLSEEIITAAQLGYIPGKPTEWQKMDGLKVPCGIAIPWYADGVLWGIKVRRSAGEQRYQQVSGGNIKGSLYLADHIRPGLPIFLTEGEFDALIAWQVGRTEISPASIGSASNWHINPRWFGRLMAAPSILVSMDSDEAGIRAAAEIKLLSSAAKMAPVPTGKDMNEAYLHLGKQAVAEWLMNLLSDM